MPPPSTRKSQLSLRQVFGISSVAFLSLWYLFVVDVPSSSNRIPQDFIKQSYWYAPTDLAVEDALRRVTFSGHLSAEQLDVGRVLVRFASPLVPIREVLIPERLISDSIGMQVQLEAFPLECRRLFMEKPNVPLDASEPPRRSELPEEMRHWFTHEGRIPMFDMYTSNAQHNSALTKSSGSTTVQFQKPFFDKLYEKCKPLSRCEQERDSDPARDMFKCPAGYPTGGGHNVCRTVEKYTRQIHGKRGFIIGSQWPWVEAILFVGGARELVTMEYANSSSDRPGFSMLHPNEVARKYLRGDFSNTADLFDFGFTFSSLEHDGMGRYGDPLNPNGDLEAIAQAACLLKPGGFFFAGMPTMADAVVWNDQRVYGHKRLALLFSPFRIIEAIGEQPFVDKALPVAQRDPRQNGNPCNPLWACNYHIVYALQTPSRA